jgi:SAM-dependent methyltransferase
MARLSNLPTVVRNVLGALAAQAGLRLRHRKRGYRQLSGRGLEIGALNSPAKLSARCAIEYCDVLSKEDALQQFPELKANRFVDVNYVLDLDREGLSYFTDAEFDFVIMNHVIEHIANPIRVVRDIFRTLKAGGHLVISAPDKTFTYDRDRPLTSFEHLWSEYEAGVSEITDEHYLDFLRAVHPATLVDPEGISLHIQHARDRREHAHVWNSSTFHAFIQQTLSQLNINATCLFKSDGAENRMEFFAVWQKHDHPDS